MPRRAGGNTDIILKQHGAIGVLLNELSNRRGPGKQVSHGDMSVIPSISPSDRAARLSADKPQELAFRALVRTMGLLDRVMQPYFAQFGISGTKWGALRALHRAEAEGHAGLRMTELSERLLVRPPSVTGVVDRLERDGLVARDAALEDLRAKLVRLTAKGRRLVEQVLAGHAGQIAEFMSGLKSAEQVELMRLLERLSGHLEIVAERAERGEGSAAAQAE